MLEVEIKFSVTDAEALRTRLATLGARFGETRSEVDCYFNAPDRDFAATDEAVRLRSVENSHRLTYKGPKIDPQTKTRTEIEVPLAADPEAATLARSFLEHLRYRPVAILRKERATYHLDRGGLAIEICLDRVEEVGTYVELETLVPEDQLAAARTEVLALARELGLETGERRSYLELWLSGRGRA